MCEFASSPPSRRQLLAAVGIGAAAALAGCLGDDSDDDPADDADPADDDEGEFWPSDEVPVDELAEVPAEAVCVVCPMPPAEYPDWNAQAAHEDGTRAFFCSPGCAIAYTVYPDVFDAPEASLANWWVTDVATGEAVDGHETYYVLDSNPDRAHGPMVNPYPFADREGALEYAGEYDDLEEDDVIAGDELDSDVAMAFRETYVERARAE
ncbi:nitrous oxide reductase accessory protein NosL [Natrialbaceae archaeon AArc-T1-2]|uniref:nitrous oxide reductase accessory protein NosL n=1 Tax=Natrialbaceae archaeon AArc-T1-2 TaxID=3053904 RepID=UPI00255AFCBB|nr:nitrous oxide reductase accessory protein NosL [Natrialbaceae archaeon AArc-T1-2]WIV67749.1 nitrous oxide reductase accessory protein NosL [Natrialbaceae archaeon AArc-T1-2]